MWRCGVVVGVVDGSEGVGGLLRRFGEQVGGRGDGIDVGGMDVQVLVMSRSAGAWVVPMGFHESALDMQGPEVRDTYKLPWTRE